ncbi:hypothetical protein GJ744_010360 [Endocarpon pusillum]|uniref:Uncharacterized protein n=1 Tax=Endocarpon pusillum TaxID=364733 RepID=A0A8H7AGB7_9EURO|nr:hypothetical protein GJ744_010360 [Endocarpon pusillum]
MRREMIPNDDGAAGKKAPTTITATLESSKWHGAGTRGGPGRQQNVSGGGSTRAQGSFGGFTGDLNGM